MQLSKIKEAAKCECKQQQLIDWLTSSSSTPHMCWKVFLGKIFGFTNGSITYRYDFISNRNIQNLLWKDMQEINNNQIKI